MEKKEPIKIGKAKFVEMMATKNEMTKYEAAKAYDAFIGTLTEAMEKNIEVSMMGFGSFHLTSVKARYALNPLTGKKIRVKAHKRVAFKASSRLKEKVK